MPRVRSLDDEGHRHDESDHDHPNDRDADEVAVNVRVVRGDVVLAMMAGSGTARSSPGTGSFDRVSGGSRLFDLSGQRFGLNARNGAGERVSWGGAATSATRLGCHTSDRRSARANGTVPCGVALVAESMYTNTLP